MDDELERLKRANAELQAWVNDLLSENRGLRDRLAEAESSRLSGAAEGARSRVATPVAWAV